MLVLKSAITENPGGTGNTPVTLLAFGLNHATAPVEVRERVVITPDDLPGALHALQRDGAAAEAAILSTCNRTEVYCAVADPDSDRPLHWFSRFFGPRAGNLDTHIYVHPDANAVKHVLRVASGLDSMILGEPQVLGQLKSAYQAGVRAGSVGRLLGRLFQHSFRVAKEIRSNTAIGSHPVSVAFAAVRLAHQIFGRLDQGTALLVGAGETIELTARHLAEHGLRRLIVANRSLERAQRLAGEYGGYAISLQDLPRHLYEADIVICSTASAEPVLDRATVQAALAQRRHRPMFILDIAVPRDVDPAAGELEDVYLYTVDDLHGVIEENLRTRREAARQAEEIIDTQVVHFMQWLESRDTFATIRALRERAGDIQREVTEDALRRLRHGEDPERVVHEVARLLTNRLMHAPSAQLRAAGAAREDLARALKELFALDPAPGGGRDRR
jgi:glutamyl-tRNA reductase